MIPLWPYAYWLMKLPPFCSPLPDWAGEGRFPLMMLVAICWSWLLETLEAPLGAFDCRSCSTLESSELLEIVVTPLSGNSQAGVRMSSWLAPGSPPPILAVP